MLKTLLERFRTWNHTRLANRDRTTRTWIRRAWGPGNAVHSVLSLSRAEKDAVLRTLAPISDRGPAVNDLDYAARIASLKVDRDYAKGSA